ncbi:NADP-dependent malic enzyme [Flavobacteriaceae bacterium]|jgi:malate dehydrogenase (oxaloacetate-decarboxylating)(NADP+)|nr:NADP-dependent malic enzyme [Flavobacteriaceae bacterium]MBT7573305.1 NADP-dependent malic enzyme [Flavobacteriaceae bacterium]MDB2567020.1 NADP-dependent malic enzyme [Flavobacteriaceae bacterium]MDB4819893.1 NADP-dependent malic enzyme [Flavobacteriaceae bacterium]MDC0924377.1 NADP-dependent malic enzyme [Flavobacteriaceae bacterium]
MKNKNNRRAALVYHAKPNPGKIEVNPTTKYSSQRDLALAYSPGVAFPCLEIEKEPSNVYKYTAKGNLVAVITNGTAVLGLGDIGPEASKPVMEGKALLFKIFAGIDVFDIEIDASDPEKFIETVKNIAPTFGGINLEDIKAPEAFEIEKRLSEELDIPVMHDDQHGTAIISAAALLNALELAEKKIEKVKVVVCGAGAAAISCTRMYKALGLKKENIVMTDSKGVISVKRDNLTKEKAEFATKRKLSNLKEAMVDADVFIGLSKADMVTPKMLLSMAKSPIVFAMANPDPEINYSLAMKTRKDIIMATGRSDHPNQVNNVLGFPFIFRGALDVKATKINDEMKMAAVKALSALAKETVPEFVNIAYDKTKLTFGKDYIIPKPFDPRLITKIPPMVAKAAIDSGVAQEPIENWDKYEEELHSRLYSDKKIVRLLLNRAKANPKKIVFAEADHLDVLKAAQIVSEEGIGFPVLLGDVDIINELRQEIEFDDQVIIIDPKSDSEKKNREKYGTSFWNKRKRKGVTLLDSIDKMKQRNYYAGMMLSSGDVDALISGYSRSYPATFKPIIETIGKSKGINKVATTNLMITNKGPLFFSDTSINIDPSSKDLAVIAKMTAETVKMFGIKPIIAMVSYSNFGSSSHPMASKVNQAVKYLHRYYPDLNVDGEIQSDFALNKEMLSNKFEFSKLSGKNVNTLIFPNLDSANTNYKLVKELDKALSIGPIMMGMSKAAHIIQLGASVDEIVNMSALAVVDAQKKIKLKL